MSNKIWNVKRNYKPGDDVTKALVSRLGITSESEIDSFLNPPRAAQLVKTFSQEFRESLQAAKSLIESHISQNNKIVIYGDYDADGVCATSILFNYFFGELGYSNCITFIPSRFDHGYGLSVKALDEIFSKHSFTNSALFITVDTGITAVEESAYIRSKGIDLIITDHHQKPEILPDANVIVWNDQIVGSTISWILSKVLGSTSSQSIGLAALATVTDLQPLLAFNRSLVREGLEVINNNPSEGIKKLLQASGRKEGEVTVYDLGFVLGPRLNASGRLADADKALQLLTQNDDTKLTEIALTLNQVNTQRQDKTLEMYDIAAELDKGDVPRVIISAHSDYHEGIIGLVASKLVQKYYRPAIVISLSDAHGKGSVRSIPGIDIISVLRKFQELFLNLGGHPMAAGFTIKLENLDKLKESLLKEFEEAFDDSYFQPYLDIDMEIPLEIVDLELLDSLQKLKPFGIGNKEPLFLSTKAGIVSIGAIGRDGSHLLFKFYNGDRYYKGIMFGGAPRMSEFSVGNNVDIVFSIKENNYNGMRSVDLVISDLKKSH